MLSSHWALTSDVLCASFTLFILQTCFSHCGLRQVSAYLTTEQTIALPRLGALFPAGVLAELSRPNWYPDGAQRLCCLPEQWGRVTGTLQQR